MTSRSMGGFLNRNVSLQDGTRSLQNTATGSGGGGGGYYVARRTSSSNRFGEHQQEGQQQQQLDRLKSREQHPERRRDTEDHTLSYAKLIADCVNAIQSNSKSSCKVGKQPNSVKSSPRNILESIPVVSTITKSILGSSSSSSNKSNSNVKSSRSLNLPKGESIALNFSSRRIVDDAKCNDEERTCEGKVANNAGDVSLRSAARIDNADWIGRVVTAHRNSSGVGCKEKTFVIGKERRRDELVDEPDEIDRQTFYVQEAAAATSSTFPGKCLQLLLNDDFSSSTLATDKLNVVNSSSDKIEIHIPLKRKSKDGGSGGGSSNLPFLNIQISARLEDGRGGIVNQQKGRMLRMSAEESDGAAEDSQGPKEFKIIKTQVIVPQLPTGKAEENNQEKITTDEPSAVSSDPVYPSSGQQPGFKSTEFKELKPKTLGTPLAYNSKALQKNTKQNNNKSKSSGDEAVDVTKQKQQANSSNNKTRINEPVNKSYLRLSKSNKRENDRFANNVKIDDSSKVKVTSAEETSATSDRLCNPAGWTNLAKSPSSTTIVLDSPKFFQANKVEKSSSLEVHAPWTSQLPKLANRFESPNCAKPSITVKSAKLLSSQPSPKIANKNSATPLFERNMSTSAFMSGVQEDLNSISRGNVVRETVVKSNVAPPPSKDNKQKQHPLIIARNMALLSSNNSNQSSTLDKVSKCGDTRKTINLLKPIEKREEGGTLKESADEQQSSTSSQQPGAKSSRSFIAKLLPPIVETFRHRDEELVPQVKSGEFVGTCTDYEKLRLAAMTEKFAKRKKDKPLFRYMKRATTFVKATEQQQQQPPPSAATNEATPPHDDEPDAPVSTNIIAQ